jgi:hypothetical protein
MSLGRVEGIWRAGDGYPPTVPRNPSSGVLKTHASHPCITETNFRRSVDHSGAGSGVIGGIDGGGWLSASVLRISLSRASTTCSSCPHDVGVCLRRRFEHSRWTSRMNKVSEGGCYACHVHVLLAFLGVVWLGDVVWGCRMTKRGRTVGFEPPTRSSRLVFAHLLLPLSVPLLLSLFFLPSFSTSHYSPHVLPSISFDVSWRESVCERR